MAQALRLWSQTPTLPTAYDTTSRKTAPKSVVHINLADLNHPVPFNPFAGFWEEEYRDLRHLVCSNIMAAFRKIWADQWSTTRMARVLRHTIMALLEYPRSNMLSIQLMLTDKAYRFDVVQNYVTDPVVLLLLDAPI